MPPLVSCLMLFLILIFYFFCSLVFVQGWTWGGIGGIVDDHILAVREEDCNEN